MSSMRSLLVLLSALLCCCGPALVAGGSQLRAIWVFKSVEYSQEHPGLLGDEVTDFINLVINPLTNILWGNPIQSGGFDSLCMIKLGLEEGCKAYSRRRLLQYFSPKTYIYLDSSNPPDAAGTKQLLADSMADGSFTRKMEGTLLASQADQVQLWWIYINESFPDPSPSPSESPPVEVPTPNAPTPSAPPTSSSPDPLAGAPTTDGELFPAPIGNSSPPPESSGGGGTSSALIAAIVGGVVAVAVIAVLIGACMVHNKRKNREKVNADLMVHRWRREREQAAASKSTTGGRSPFDRAASVHEARTMSGRDLNHDAFKSFRSTPSSTQRATLGLGKGSWADRNESSPLPPSASITPQRGADAERNTVLSMGQERSSPPQLPPQEKKGFLGMFGRKG